MFFFSITLKPRVESYTKSMSLKYEPASEPLHISVKQLFSNRVPFVPRLPLVTPNPSNVADGSCSSEVVE